MKKIGILGSGIVGKTLAAGFLKHGYQVMVGTRDSTKLTAWKDKEGQNASIGSFAEAAAFGELVVLAVKGVAAHDALTLAGPENLKGKTVIDTTNPIGAVPPVNCVLNFSTSINHSLMEQLQKDFEEANFVKAFNSIGSAFMVNPDFGGVKPSMFICGNSNEAKQQVTAILDQFGFETEDFGKAESARAIEPLCMLWCIPGMLNNQWSHAFKLLKKG